MRYRADCKGDATGRKKPHTNASLSGIGMIPIVGWVATGVKGTKAVPVVEFSRSRAPGIAQNIEEALAAGKPERLTRVDREIADKNRTKALNGVQRPPRGSKLSLDEYPFASSLEGGLGAFVKVVPEAEQHYQGGVLGSFFRAAGIKPGDIFEVRIVD